MPPVLTPSDLLALRRQGFYIEFPEPSKVTAGHQRPSYIEARRLGLCTRCGQKAAPGRNGKPGVLCYAHQEINRKESAERRRKLRERLAERMKMRAEGIGNKEQP